MAMALAVIRGQTAWDVKGSTNPAVWSERVTIVMHTDTSPTPDSKPTPSKSEALPPAAPLRQTPAEPSGQPEPSSSPEPRESPEPSDDHSGSGITVVSGSRTSTPPPYPAAHLTVASDLAL